MSEFKKVDPVKFNESPFRKIGKDWMLVAAEKGGKVNAMTASWGGIGVLWGKNVAFVFIRKSRYTKEFVDSSETFSLSFFNHAENADILNYMGKVSGREEDKIAKCGLTVNHAENTPYFDEAETVMLCRKMAVVPISADNYLDPSIDGRWYADKDYHDMYVAEILDILEK